MLRNLSARSRSLIATLVGRSAVAHRRRSRHGRRRRPIGAELLESRAMLATTATLSGDLSGFTQIPVTFLRPDGSVGFSRTAYVGQLGWSAMTGDAAAAGVPAAFKSFCIDGLQSVAPGTNSFAEVRPLAASSLLGATRAGLLTDFWRQYGPADAAGFADKTDSAAFQLAVWEIINDGLPVGTRLASDLATGQFSVAAAGRTMPAALRAAQWLAGFDTTAPGKTAVALHALQSPTRQDQVVCVPLPNINVQVAPSSVTEDGPQKLTYTFTATGPLPRDVTVNYAIGGSATAGIDFTGLPAGASTGAITIPANSGAPNSAATLAITPTLDTVVEFDETVVIMLQPGTGYTFDTTRPPATGTIENDDYRLDLILDGLPEETAPEPNELSPGAILPIGGGRTRLDLIVESPGYAGAVTLFVTTGADGADAVTLWDSEEDGTQVLPTTWQVGQHPRTLWVETTGVEADIQFIAMFQNKGTSKQDAAQAKPRTAAWSTAGAIANGNPDGQNQITPTFKPLTYAVDVDLATGDPAGTPPPGGPDDNALKGTAERLNKWMDAFAKQAGLGTDDKGRQFVGLTESALPGARPSIKASLFPKPKDGDFQNIGNAVRDGVMRNNIWRIEFVPVVAPWEWNATITLPEWKQFTTEKDRLNPNVEEEWKTFVAALAGHEEIHKTKWDQYVRAYQSLVDDFAKTRFFGEAADPNNGMAKSTAWNNAKRLFETELDKLRNKLKALTDAYNEEQSRYDVKSDHGRTQTLYDPAGQNVKAVNPGLRLQK
jgi:hypothetical protein